MIYVSASQPRCRVTVTSATIARSTRSTGARRTTLRENGGRGSIDRSRVPSRNEIERPLPPPIKNHFCDTFTRRKIRPPRSRGPVREPLRGAATDSTAKSPNGFWTVIVPRERDPSQALRATPPPTFFPRRTDHLSRACPIVDGSPVRCVGRRDTRNRARDRARRVFEIFSICTETLLAKCVSAGDRCREKTERTERESLLNGTVTETSVTPEIVWIGNRVYISFDCAVACALIRRNR